jgi:hypothetical protein
MPGMQSTYTWQQLAGENGSRHAVHCLLPQHYGSVAYHTLLSTFPWTGHGSFHMVWTVRLILY